MSSVRFSQNSSEAKISNFHFSLVSINKDVITLKISMDYRGIMAMKIEKPIQDLSAPALYCSNIDSFVFQPIPTKPHKQKSKDLRVLMEEEIQI